MMRNRAEIVGNLLIWAFLTLVIFLMLVGIELFTWKQTLVIATIVGYLFGLLISIRTDIKGLRDDLQNRANRV